MPGSADAAGIANIDKGARAGFEHISKVFGGCDCALGCMSIGVSSLDKRKRAACLSLLDSSVFDTVNGSAFPR